MRVRASTAQRAALPPLLLVPLILLPLGCAARCGWPSDTPLPSNNRFAVVLSGSPKTYVPGQTYRVSVAGSLDGDVPLKFIGFSLTVESAPDDGLGPIGRRRAVGHFTLYGDALAKFDERCANTVTHATYLPTAEVQVLWTAPPPNSGCVVFRAMVQETRDTWYADESPPLTQTVCEDAQENLDEQRAVLDPCCACDEAKYEVTFEGLWSRHTHPKDFPADSWVTRFSDVIGASHDVNYRFWEYNGMASEGLKQVAERGATRALEAELKAQSEHIRTIIKARGISYPNVTGKTFAVFRVDRQNHLMSLVSMIDPSPDWIVGVSGLELCLENCSWAERVQLNLYPYDAGTDSGLTYIAPDQPTMPREPIRKMSSSFPNDMRSPFFDPSGEPMRPMAKLSLVRQRLYEKSCDDPSGEAGEEQDPDGSNREGCEVGPWSAWTPCPVTCGQGTRHRQRFFVDPNMAEARSCSAMLTQRQQCHAPIRQCPGMGGLRGYEYDNPECELEEWSSWSSCSSSCGQGTRTRSRRYRIRENTKRCQMAENRPPLQQNQPCYGTRQDRQDGDEDGSCDGVDKYNAPELPNGCVLSEWTQFSSCSVTCGRGIQVRKRWPLDRPVMQDGDDVDAEEAEDDGDAPMSGPCAGVRMREQVVCTADLPTCHLGPEQARGPFGDMVAVSQVVGEDSGAAFDGGVTTGILGRVVDCRVSGWSSWTPCDRTCGVGYKVKQRTILESPQNGGQPCPKKLLSRKKCQRLPPCGGPGRPPPETDDSDPGEGDYHNRRESDCVMTRWSEWSQCTASCGSDAVQIRTRAMMREAGPGGAPCGKQKDKRNCDLLPCTR